MSETETDVKSARRVLQIFQLFAELRGPASLATISKRLQLPKSSCLGLLKTLELHGYLYSLNDSRDYYPTRRIWDEAKTIVAHDPLLAHLRPAMKDLARETGETVFLARRSGQQTHYLEVIESGQVLRYAARVGEKRPLHIGAAGQALLSAMDEDERNAVIDGLQLEAFSSKTVTHHDAYRKLIAEGKKRGWYMSLGGYQEEVASIGHPLRIAGETYALVVGGPAKRLKDNADAIGRAVVASCRRIAG